MSSFISYHQKRQLSRQQMSFIWLTSVSLVTSVYVSSHHNDAGMFLGFTGVLTAELRKREKMIQEPQASLPFLFFSQARKRADTTPWPCSRCVHSASPSSSQFCILYSKIWPRGDSPALTNPQRPVTGSAARYRAL